MRLKRWLPKSGKDVRTWLLFFGGLAGVGYEALVSGVERPYLLVIFASMMGLPLFLGRDEAPHTPPPSGLPTTPALPPALPPGNPQEQTQTERDSP